MKKLLMSLLLVGGGFVGLVRGAQERRQDKVPSLQMLCLKRLLANKDEEQAQEVLKQLPVPANFYFKLCHGDISREILKLALEEYKKRSYARESTVMKYKKANPGFGLLLARGAVSYSLSIQDLIDAGVAMNQSSLSFSALDITSLDGLQNTDLPALRELDLSGNQIKEIAPGAFDNLPFLTHLEFFDNQIREIAPGVFDNLPVLQFLNLSRNQIREIVPGTFNNLPVLEHLFLRENKIERIMSGAFNNLPALEYLDLSANQIREIAPEVRAQLSARTRVLF